MPATTPTEIRSSENFGASLQTRRTGLGLSVEDLAQTTNIRPEYITAIERLDQDALPAIGYTLGYVRAYAEALGMDGKLAVKQFKADVALSQMPLRDAPHVIFRRHWRLPRGFVSAMTVAGAALTIGLWYGAQSAAVAAPQPAIDIAPQYTALEPAMPEMQDGLFTLRATAPSWIQIRNAQGTVEESRIFVTGETWQGETRAGYAVSVRDAGAVELYSGPELIGTLGEPGVHLRDFTLSQDLPTSDRP